MSIIVTNPSDNLTSITSHGFTYNPSSGALIADISRDPESRIRALLFPHLIPTLIKGKRAQKQAEKEARRLTKKWISAQHKHYGIPFKATAKVDDLRASLIAALEAGKLKSPPAGVQEILKGLEEEYKRKNAAHLVAVNKTRHEAFAALTDPIDAANYNSELFLRRYFLDSAGRLDKKKAPAAMDLHRVRDRDRFRLAAAARAILGLHVEDAHDDPFYNILVVGKDQESVRNMARMKVEEKEEERRQAATRRELEEASLKESFAREKEQSIKQFDDDFRPLMESHFAFVKSLPKPGPTASVANAKGTFHIRCPEIEGSWPDSCYDGLTLVIRDDPERTNTSGGPCLRGDFEFGVLSGIMHFWLAGEDWQTDYDGPDEDSSDEEYESHSLDKKRQKPTTSRGPVSKKRAVAVSAADSRKLHFLWRGRESGEGEIQVDYQNTNKGCIEFRDNTFTVFDATWSADLLGDDVKFSGHKTSANGKGNGIRWEELGEKAYRRAEISRW
ncbi:hypothetical protein K440DRAFT_626266 [Wilcoxina mikolae CBS 423.85]|nr:hypothetical protein K440DRAFT_626266 [Wilcoxina mikolae CBS 423.85]